MKIRYTDRSMIMRFGAGPLTVSDEMGARLMREKKAIPITSFETPPIDKDLRDDKGRERLNQPKKTTGLRPRVGWVQDTGKFGGAELSNLQVVKVGEELGYDFYTCTPSNFSKGKLITCDFLVVNNFFLFKPEQYHFILDLLFEHSKPYVKYEHDHREIMGTEARPKLARALFGRSFLNVFISPFQVENHRKYLGDLIEPYYLLPPAVDTGRFKIIRGIERDPKLMVNTSGRLFESKGYYRMLQFALSKKKYNFEIYSRNYRDIEKPFEQLKNVRVFPPVENDYLPQVYNRAAYTVHLPQAYEACGRTIAEGVLCGCEPIMNDNVGIKSFKEFHLGDKRLFKYEKFKCCIEQGPYSFWKAVWRYYNGLDKVSLGNMSNGWKYYIGWKKHV